MKKYLLLLAFIALLIGLAVSTGHSAEKEKAPALTMQLSSPKTSLEVEEKPQVVLSITNNGEEPVTLVHPGEGSDTGMRTPIIRWSVLYPGSPYNHPARPKPQKPTPGCGDISDLTDGEVFSIAPGESKNLNVWFPLKPFKIPGEYRVVFLYENLPALEWDGHTRDDTAAMERARNSTRCLLVSNEITFTISKQID